MLVKLGLFASLQLPQTKLRNRDLKTVWGKRCPQENRTCPLAHWAQDRGWRSMYFLLGGGMVAPTVYVGTEWREKKLRSVFEGFKKHQKRT